LDDTNFILQGEDGVDLKMLDDIVDDDGVGTMAEGVTPTEEEYGDMLVDLPKLLRIKELLLRIKVFIGI